MEYWFSEMENADGFLKTHYSIIPIFQLMRISKVLNHFKRR